MKDEIKLESVTQETHQHFHHMQPGMLAINNRPATQGEERRELLSLNNLSKKSLMSYFCISVQTLGFNSNEQVFYGSGKGIVGSGGREKAEGCAVGFCQHFENRGCCILGQERKREISARLFTLSPDLPHCLVSVIHLFLFNCIQL